MDLTARPDRAVSFNCRRVRTAVMGTNSLRHSGFCSLDNYDNYRSRTGRASFCRLWSSRDRNHSVGLGSEPGLSNSGAVELIARYVVNGSRTVTMHIGLMSGVGAALSALMNNVAALALLMPVDGEAAKRADRSPALTLMPLSFATILGGMVTLIGTPPNIVVATFRNDALGEPFRMFDFAAVGGVVAIVGVVFVALFGWRLLPSERVKRDVRKELQDLAGYVSEATVLQDSNFVGESLREVFPLAEDHDVAILGLVRNGRRLPGSGRREKVRIGDLVVMEGAATAIEAFIGAAGLEFASTDQNVDVLGESQSLTEVVVPEGARIEGRSAMDLRLAYRQGVMLLGVLRQGTPFRDRVRKTPAASRRCSFALWARRSIA